MRPGGEPLAAHAGSAGLPPCIINIAIAVPGAQGFCLASPTLQLQGGARPGAQGFRPASLIVQGRSLALPACAPPCAPGSSRQFYSVPAFTALTLKKRAVSVPKPVIVTSCHAAETASNTAGVAGALVSYVIQPPTGTVKSSEV